MEVRRKAISIVLSMTSSRNVEEVVVFLKKQLQKTQEADFEKVWNFCLIRRLYGELKASFLVLHFRLLNIVNCLSSLST